MTDPQTTNVAETAMNVVAKAIEKAGGKIMFPHTYTNSMERAVQDASDEGLNNEQIYRRMLAVAPNWGDKS